MSMISIGVDPHKSTHTATAVDSVTNADVGSLRIEATLAAYCRMLAWAKQWPKRRWAIGNAEGLGHHLAQWLGGSRRGRGGCVNDGHGAGAPPLAWSVPQGRSHRWGRCCVCGRPAGGCRPVVPEGYVDVLGLLDERRNNLTQSRTRIVNQLHGLLGDLLAGGAPATLTAAKAATVIRGLRPRTSCERVRLMLCRELIGDIRRLDAQLADNQAQITALLDEHGTRLREIDGVGPVLAARIRAVLAV